MQKGWWFVRTAGTVYTIRKTTVVMNVEVASGKVYTDRS